MKIKSMRVGNYAGTFDMDSIKDMEAVAAIRKAIRGTGLRLKLQGRLGKNNPNRYKYLTKDGKWPTWAVCISLKDAAYADGYYYEIDSYGSNHSPR
jgi:hypothetical protein